MVRLPFKGGRPSPSLKLSDSVYRARNMLLNLKKKFERDPNLKTAYKNGIQDYKTSNHMMLHGSLPDKLNNYEGFFLPHHGVLKENSTTTKLRTVFNGSRKLRSGISLNDLLHAGPNSLPHQPDLICRWRRYRYVFSADIEKMIRKIKVHLPLLVILIFLIVVLSFGLVCSPYIANRCVKQLAIEHADFHPLGADVAVDEIYMDDVCSGGHTMEETNKKLHETYEMFALGGFPLRKWVSNHPALLKNLPKNVLADEPFALRDASCGTSILGLYWLPTDDKFCYKITETETLSKITKRAILSRIARIFDPMGWIAPIVVLAKMLMRELWVSKTGWDEPVNSECLRLWRNSETQLPNINEIEVPRWNGFSLTLQKALTEPLCIRG